MSAIASPVVRMARAFLAAAAAATWCLSIMPPAMAEQPAGASASSLPEAIRLFAAGNSEYEAGRYEEAARDYRQLITQGYGSEAVHFNLGNALYKTGRIGPAILEYEKAAAMAPNDAEVRSNLEFVRSLTADKTTGGAQTTSFFVERLLSLTTPDQDAVALLALFLAMGALVAIRIAGGAEMMRRLAVWGMVVLALPLLVAASAYSIKLYRAATTTQAIVLAERLDVRSGPGEDNTTLFTVHEGLKLRVRSEQGAWLLVSLENGLNGWVPASSVGVI